MDSHNGWREQAQEAGNVRPQPSLASSVSRCETLIVQEGVNHRKGVKVKVKGSKVWLRIRDESAAGMPPINVPNLCNIFIEATC